MPALKPFMNETIWARFEPTEADWESEDPVVLARMLEQLQIIRVFEEKVLELKGEQILHGPAHSSIGQEGAAVGCISVLGAGDKINGTHRMHHQFLAKVLNWATPAGYDPRQAEPGMDMRSVIERTLAEIMGLKTGFCGGRGGSMHLRFAEAGCLGSNAIVGGNPPHAVGYAFADKYRGRDNVSVTFFGDGATQMGTTVESINLAALYDCPTIFFIENNYYAVSTHVREQTRETRLTSRGACFGVPALEVDGMDPFAVRKAMQWAVDYIRTNRGPVLIEAVCYRHFHQQGPIPGSAFGYRDKTEEQDWLERDPLETIRSSLSPAASFPRIRWRHSPPARAALSSTPSAWWPSLSRAATAAVCRPICGPTLGRSRSASAAILPSSPASAPAKRRNSRPKRCRR